MAYKIDRKEILYLITITIYLVTVLLSFTVFQENDAFVSMSQYVRYFCYLLAVIKILCDHWDRKSIIAVCIIAVLMVVVAMQMDSNVYLFDFLMLVAARDVNIRKLIQWICIMQGIVLALFIFASETGLIENYLFLQEGGRYRYGLGFLYTTFAPALYFFFMLEYIYLRREKMRIYEFAALGGIAYWLFIMTDSRLIFYLSVIMLLYAFFMRYFWQNREERIRKNRWLLLAPSGICVGAILLHVFYNSESKTWVALNQFLNGRLNLGHEALNTYNIALFGQHITWVNNVRNSQVGEYNFVDCSYLNLLLAGGIVTLILVIAGITYVMYLAIQTRDFYLQTMLLFMLILCITETRLMSVAFNPCLFLAAMAFRTRPLEELCRKEPRLIPGFQIRAARIRFKDRDWKRRGGASWKKTI